MLKIYIGFDSFGGRQEGACLVFAHNRKEARKLAYPIINDWFGSSWIDCSVNLLTMQNYLYELADQEKLKKDEAHAIDDPESCKNCGMWGDELDENGVCTQCKENKDWNQCE